MRQTAVQLQNAAVTCIQVRWRGAVKRPEWRYHRWAKVVNSPQLFQIDNMRRRETMNLDELRREQAKFQDTGMGRVVVNPEKDLHIASTGRVFDNYVPPMHEDKASFKNPKQKLGQTWDRGARRAISVFHARKVKRFESGFKRGKFIDTAVQIYKEAHHLLQHVEENEDRLHELVTEYAFVLMTSGLQYKTLRWRYVEALEAPKVINIVTEEVFGEGNVYGQVTVRFHTRQLLALYDRFGRLVMGSEHQVRDVLEYVVFENHLADEYGSWRIHAKLAPEWLQREQRATPLTTYRRPNHVFEEEAEEVKTETGAKDVTVAKGGTELKRGTDAPV